MDSESTDSSSQPQTKASGVETSAEDDTDVKRPDDTNDMKSHSMANNVEPPVKAYDIEPPKAGDNASTVSVKTISSPDPTTFDLPSTGISSWTRHFKLSQPIAPPQASQAENAGTSAFARLTSGLGLRLQSMTLPPDNRAEPTSTGTQAVLESFKKGIVDSSLNAVKAVQVKTRHMVSQNKRRYQGRYKVYNLCSERLYDASLFRGKVASFPFNDHNCPPLHLIKSFCQSAYSWLKEDIENVVAVHCKAGMGRTGLMICSLLLFLKFFPTAEEAIDYFNQKRCVDGKALVLPSQIRYVKYFGRILTHFHGENRPGRRCMIRGFRLHKCPYWIRPSITISDHSGTLFSTSNHPKTKNLMPEDFWIKAPKKGIVIFALPREPGLSEVAGDFKIHFHDRQGDFYCWLNTTMVENRTILNASDLDGFDKRNVPYHGFKIELVMVDYDDAPKANSKSDSANRGTEGNSGYVEDGAVKANSKQSKASSTEESDDIFSDSDEEESGASTSKPTQPAAAVGPVTSSNLSTPSSEQIGTSMLSVKNQELLSNSSSKDIAINGSGKPSTGLELPSVELMGASDIKAMAADASVFSFGDEEDYESE
ncbi:phosphatidylinositol 3,4,5-trisphosphate 3-phosphatase and protein-tyrosine-phosphatase PTEN2A-like isoform X5 [Hibiscus syriacus]|uniref:phosphatidylinositol 3,4,5-trisphosphate 3-phosphatase and protein-tyrosine-phosphatase PTEN2A-like isoform X5 n=1 Tax=Hibiscus syriacus TaxID=106335 RepID=UPI0019243687|nr:phosphatidylinositol 3,4,5-trisphosphate 3-phosphatase and protein-tyrosine-phosphatase PTEN2A-like isoform X5 [Hibiscus syriacus]